MSEEGTTLAEATVTHARETWLRWLGRLLWVPLLPLAALVPWAWSFGRDGQTVVAILTGVMGFALFAMTPFLPLFLQWFAVRRRTGQTVSGDRHGLQIAGDTIPADQVAFVWRPRPTQIEVVLRSGDELLLELATPEAANDVGAILHGHVDRDRSYALVGETPWARFVRQTAAWIVPGVVATTAAAAYAPLATLFGVGGLIAWSLGWGTRRLRFAADGLTIEGRVRRRYLAYRDLLDVAVEERRASYRVVATLHGGGRVVLFGRASGSRAHLVAAIVEEGIQMAKRGAAAGAHVPNLERVRDEGDDELRRKLAAIAKGGDYRGAAIDPARLDLLMRNPAADNDQRIAAAFALRETKEGRAKIRVAAEVSAEPEVRDALAALAEEELEVEAARAIVRRIG